MPPDMALSVGVVGAGIAGLGAAIALRRAGHDVEVFERSSFKNEVGAAITMTSNATRCLNRWGFDYEKARAVECAQIRMPMATDLQMIFQDSFETAEEDYGARMWFFHRVDLHSELRAMAENPDSAKGKLVEIRLGTEVADMDPEDGVLHMADGTRIQKDLLILADGQHSPFLEKITGQTLPMVKTGRSSFRALIPFDKLMADPVTRAQFHNESPGFHVAFMPPHDGKGPVFAVTYPCRDSELLNCAIVHDTRPEDAHKDDWNSPASSAELMDCLKDFNPRLKAIFEKADVVKVYTLMHHAPPDRMVNGRAVVIGDASHPMLPTHAQGGSQSLEDAATLEVLFENVSDPSTIQERLQLFDQLRVKRCGTAQVLSNLFGTGKDAEATEEVKKYYDGPVPPTRSMPFSKPFRDIFCAYDVFSEAEKAIKTSMSR